MYTNFGCPPFMSKITVINVQQVFKALYTILIQWTRVFVVTTNIGIAILKGVE